MQEVFNLLVLVEMFHLVFDMLLKFFIIDKTAVNTYANKHEEYSIKYHWYQWTNKRENNNVNTFQCVKRWQFLITIFPFPMKSTNGSTVSFNRYHFAMYNIFLWLDQCNRSDLSYQKIIDVRNVFRRLPDLISVIKKNWCT